VISDSETIILAARPSLQDARGDLDEQVEWLALPAVEPVVFNYLAPLELYSRERPYRLQLPPLDGFKMTNIATKHYPVKIHDISGHEDLFTLAESGFQFTKCPVTVRDWTAHSMAQDYIPELKDWLTQYLGCESIFIYSYNVSVRINFCYHFGSIQF
jgi:hypothetical protein